MSPPLKRSIRLSPAMLAVMLVAVAFSAAAAAHESHVNKTAPDPAAETLAASPTEQAMPRMDRMMETMPGTVNLMMPQMDSARGRKLFASKGCVTCHSINGVGGHHAAALDAHGMLLMMNPFEFAAKMWRMAPAMIDAQKENLGYQILFTGDELADIIAFVHDDDEQHKFTEADIPPEIRKLMHHAHGEGHMDDQESHHH